MARNNLRSLPARFILGLLKLVFLLIAISILLVLFYRFVPVPYTLTMLFDDNPVTKDWTPIEDIDPDMVAAAIGAEDSKFCQHEGFDWEAIEEARRRNAAGGRLRGGSTISQQTAKNVFLWQGGGYARKGVEAYFTFLIEKLWPKRRIMEVYLNVAETGIGTYGVEAGAQRYFGKSASSLSAREAAAIAAVLPLPKERPGRGATGFTARYGATIASRIGVVNRDGLAACVYDEGAAPQNAPENTRPDPAPAPRSAPVDPEPEAPPTEIPVDEPAADPVDPAPVEMPADSPAEPPAPDTPGV